ncbi:MAG: DNA polymerase I [Bacteroidetes bacterium]|nr:DNA polymerase I [Bacteroidota bacterium]
MNLSNKKLFLIDAMALIYRSHFAFIRNPRINSKGINTSASFGFINSIIEIIQKERPSHIIVAFDTPKPTFRHLEFKEYKAKRDAQPEDITIAIPQIKNIIKAFNIPIIEKDGFEADDIIGTIAYKIKNSGYEVYMMTPDKDFGQLVAKNVYIYKPGYLQKQTEILKEEDILNKWGIKNVKQITDIIGLWGDSSDNIPGVPGIGEKTSKRLIQQYDSIENLLKNTDKLKGKIKENLIQYSKQAQDSKKLGTIDTNVPIKLELDKSEYTQPNTKQLLEILKELEFKTIIKRLFGSTVEQQQKLEFDKNSSKIADEIIKENQNQNFKINNLHNTKHKYILINDLEGFLSLYSKLLKQKEISFKVLGNNPNPHFSDLLGISFSFNPKNGFYIHFNKNLIIDDTIKKLTEIFNNEKILKISENLKYDLIILKKHGINISKNLFDNLIAHYLIEPDLNHDINTMSNMYLKYETQEIINYIKGNDLLNKNTLENIKENKCEFSDISLQIKHKLQSKLKIEKVEDLFCNIEMPLVSVLAEMELNGVNIDTENLNELSHEINSDIKQLEQKIYEMAGETFNINSPKQLGYILFEKLKLSENPIKTKGGQFATGENILNDLISIHPIAKLLIQYKTLSKLKSTYVDALPLLVSKDDGKIHTTYNQAIVATGRLSSTDPNLQNIPIRNKRGKQIRRAFIPSNPNFKIMAADYSQIELRIMAAFSNDQHMINAFKEGKDIHLMTASKIFNVSEKDVTSDMRAKAKSVNFGIIYGISAFGLSKILNIRRKEAHEIIQAYFKEFPDIKTYMDKIIIKAHEDGYVKTLLGRKRILNGINSRNSNVRKYAERNAINSPLQGTQAEMIKLAMVNIHDWMIKEKLKSKMIMQVHDELVFEVHNQEIDIMKKNITKLMENTLKIKVPIKVNISIGENWLDIYSNE